MTLTNKVFDANAEAIGQPLFDEYMQYFVKGDYEGLIKKSPEIEYGMSQERFDQCLENLKLLGKQTSRKYLTRLNHVDSHILLWKVRYESKQDVIWSLELDEVKGDIMPIGMRFGRIYEPLPNKTASCSIDDEGFEPIDSSMLEAVIKLHEKSDYEEFVRRFPMLEGEDFFEENVKNLKPVGSMQSIEFLTRLNKPNHYILAWKVQYEKADEDLLWELHLRGSGGDANLIGLGFSR